MIEAIKAFLDTPHTTGALLITGKWGSGKTHFVKNALSHAGGIEEKYIFVVVSLFGVNGIEDISSSVKKSYFNVKGSLIRKNKKQKTKKGGNAENDLLDGIANVLGEIDVAYGIPKALAIALRTNWKDFAPIKNKIMFKNINLGNEEREVVLVFDDFERYVVAHSTDPVHNILGIINEYSENQGFKTIILADEDKIKDISAYGEIKEKAIAQTLRFSANHNAVYEIVARKHKQNDKYHLFLNDIEDDVITVFQDTGHENIRSLINAIALFRIAFDRMIAKGLEHVDIFGFFFNFLDVFFYSRNGMLSKDWIDNASTRTFELFLEGFLSREAAGDDESRQQRRAEQQLLESQYFLRSLSDYAIRGCWQSDTLDEELDLFLSKKAKRELQLSAKEKILEGWNILAIDEAEVLAGFQEAVDEAYVKMLSFDMYLRIIHVDKALTSWGINYAPVEWDKIIQKIKELITAIERTGDFDSNKIKVLSFMPSDQSENLSDEAKRAYDILENYNGDVRKNRFNLVEALKSNDFEKVASLIRHHYFEEFDDELIACFVRCYKEPNITPLERRKLLSGIEGIIDSCSSHSNRTENILKSLNSINTEFQSICLSEGAVFSIRLHEEFTKRIVARIDELDGASA